MSSIPWPHLFAIFFLLCALTVPVSAFPTITLLNQSRIIIGEPFLFSIFTDEQAVLRVESLNASYRYNGDPNGNHTFTPQETGTHLILLLSPAAETLASEPFIAMEPTPSLEQPFPFDGPVIMGSSVEISGCGTINESVNLTQNIGSVGTSCLIVNASDIVVDCKGFSIVGNDTPDTYGILIDDKSNVTIINCTIVDYGQGILINGTGGGHIINLTAIRSSLAWGINITSATGSMIADSSFCGSGKGDVSDGGDNTWSSLRCDTASGPSCASACADIAAVETHFSDSPSVEGESIFFFLTVANIGQRDITEHFLVEFYDGYPPSGATLLGDRTLLDLPFGSNVTINQSFNLSVGVNELYFVIDALQNLSEYSVQDNNGSANITIPLYQYFFGLFNISVILDDMGNNSFIRHRGLGEPQGHILIADSDSSFSFVDLLPLTQNCSNQSATTDFSDADTALNTSLYIDSIRKKWGAGGEEPIATTSMVLAGRVIDGIPIVNSSNSSAFVTGILWDAADDSGNCEYDDADREDLVFITVVNASQTGIMGVNDYEIRVPCFLRGYAGSTELLTLYYEVV